MKRFFRILTLATICCTSLLVSSCSKEEVAGDHTPKFTKVEMSLETRATSATSVEQGDKITDVNIWAFEVAADGTVAEQPSGWGKRDYTEVYQETPTGAPVYFELPYSAEAKTYRFVALVNQSAFGNIYKPASTTVQTFTPQTTYSELTKAIFKAGMNIMEGDPSTIEAMPVSHWQDFVIGSNQTGFTASSDGTPATFVGTMTVYRALAKAQLSAKLSNDSSDNAALKITSATIHVAKDAVVPNQGYVFSGLERIDQSTTGPMAFGEYSDVTKSQIKEEGVQLRGMNNGIITKSSTNNTIIGSTFLFENHRGMAYNADNVSTTSPDGYADGTFYMKIEYEYGQAENGGIAANGKQTGKNYVPLPPTVRNVLHNVNATFKVDTDGKVTLTYTVADWEDGGEHSLNFTYPTFSVSAVKTKDGQPDYSKPTAYYVDGNNNGAFAFRVDLTAPIGKECTVTAVGGDFAIGVYKNGTGEALTDNKFTASTSDYYIIKVWPTAAYDANTSNTTKIMITHSASWTGASEMLLINAATGGTLWQDSGGDRHAILITQTAAPSSSI